MKHVLLLSMALVLTTAVTASAVSIDWIQPTITDDVNIGGNVYRQIDFNLVSNGFPTGNSVLGLSGTFTAYTGGIYSYSSNMAASMVQTGEDEFGDPIYGPGPRDLPQSYVNFYKDKLAYSATLNPDAGPYVGRMQSSIFTEVGAGIETYNYLTPSGNSLLATLYVTPGAHVGFVGTLGMGAAPNVQGEFSSVPEPGSLILLATGLVGAVAMWIRRRR